MHVHARSSFLANLSADECIVWSSGIFYPLPTELPDPSSPNPSPHSPPMSALSSIRVLLLHLKIIYSVSGVSAELLNFTMKHVTVRWKPCCLRPKSFTLKPGLDPFLKKTFSQKRDEILHTIQLQTWKSPQKKKKIITLLSLRPFSSGPALVSGSPCLNPGFVWELEGNNDRVSWHSVGCRICADNISPYNTTSVQLTTKRHMHRSSVRPWAWMMLY